VGPSLCFTDQETQEEIFGGTSSLVGQFLHPSPVQSSRSIQRMNTAGPIIPKQVLECVTSLSSTDQELQEEIFGGNSSLVGQFLHPSPVQSSSSIQCMNTVKVHKQVFILFWGTKSLHYRSRNSERDFGWNQPPCLAFIIFKIRESNVSKKQGRIFSECTFLKAGHFCHS